MLSLGENSESKVVTLGSIDHPGQADTTRNSQWEGRGQDGGPERSSGAKMMGMTFFLEREEVRAWNLEQVQHFCLGCMIGKKWVTFQDGFSPRWGMLEKKQVRRVKKTSTFIKGYQTKALKWAVCVFMCVYVCVLIPLLQKQCTFSLIY